MRPTALRRAKEKPKVPTPLRNHGNIKNQKRNRCGSSPTCRRIITERDHRSPKIGQNIPKSRGQNYWKPKIVSKSSKMTKKRCPHLPPWMDRAYLKWPVGNQIEFAQPQHTHIPTHASTHSEVVMQDCVVEVLAASTRASPTLSTSWSLPSQREHATT